jgi:hypothetical protein
MKNIILKAALKSVAQNINLDSLVDIINATGNPENAALILLGEYKAPKLDKCADYRLHSNYLSKGESYSHMELVAYNPLAYPDNAVSYTGTRILKIYLKPDDKVSLDKWHKGYRNGNVDYKTEADEEYTMEIVDVQTIGTCYCSLARWQEFMLQG